ncbi:ester cyclase [Pseudonocardia sp. NPDC046786]|uniref:ester cyclase n=1 Tax=Pseudonocardia sp. NPDC046786 TaxID=3155471 RepID=UPI00340187C4
MSSFTDKALFCSLYDQVVNAGHLERITEFVDPGFVGEFGGSSTPVHGPAEFAEVIVATRSAFPDLNVAVSGGWLLHEVDSHVVGKGLSTNRLAARIDLRGTQLGPFRGTDPSGLEMTWSEGVFGRAENGLIVELVTVVGPLLPARSVVPA